MVALQFPHTLLCRNHTIASGIEGLRVVLRRLTYPNRLEDLENAFGRATYEISYIF